jgi:hypothetical protein
MTQAQELLVKKVALELLSDNFTVGLIISFLSSIPQYTNLSEAAQGLANDAWIDNQTATQSQLVIISKNILGSQFGFAPEEY